MEKQEFNELVVTHYDKVHSKTWEAEYKIKRIDEWIAEKEKITKSKMTKTIKLTKNKEILQWITH